MRKNNILENVDYTDGGYELYQPGEMEGETVVSPNNSYSDFIPVALGKLYIGFDSGITNITVFNSAKEALGSYSNLERFLIALNRGTIDSETAYFRMAIWTGAENLVKLYQLEPWEKVDVTVGKDGTCDFDSILKANLATWDAIEPVITVKGGTYDIIQEFKDVYGNDYFKDYTGYSGRVENSDDPKEDFRYYTGIFLQNNAKYIFHPDAEVVCRVDDTMTKAVSNEFSPFNVRSGEIIGLHLTSENTRYCIHDDFGQAGSLYNKHYFENCIIKCEGKGNRFNDRCIGAGMDGHNDVLIKNCVLLCDEGNPNDMISYHNSVNEGKNQLIITGCYVDNGIRITNLGDYTVKSEAVIHDNSIGTRINVEYEAEEYAQENWRVTSYNNEFRESLLHVGICRKG